jgi:ATP-dependent Zn protease
MDTDITPTTFVSRTRSADRTTRKPLPWWDRVKVLALLALIFGLSVWGAVGDNPLMPVSEAFREIARSRWWLLALMGLELLRQINYVVEEHNAAYYGWWRRITGRWNHRVDRVSPWTRFRLTRVFNGILIILALNAFVAWRSETPFLQTLVDLPSTLIDFLFEPITSLPFIFEIILQLSLTVGVFAALFWYMGRGGVDTYFPDDITVRFDDVWGQDAVLDKMKENLVFVEDPESIEARGGHVPGGVLLYGPPGTGKTLMAEAVAGETGKPYVFVEPGAFLNMFFGVGVLKVRSLFKKLRKLALRYGGVIAFFDEADALGNRGVPSGGTGSAASRLCNGISYISDDTRSSLLFDQRAQEDGGHERGGIARLFMPGMRGGGGDISALQALLAQMSGLTKPRGFMNRYVRRLLGMQPKPPPKYRIFFIMASNMPESLDAALLRPGRLDRKYKVGYPSKDGRRRTFEGYLGRVKHVLTDDDIEQLAVISPYATGASIKNTVNEALIHAIGEGRDTITWPDMLAAKHVEQHGLPDEFEYAQHEGHAVAIHEACHAIAFYRLSKTSVIDVATIERRGDTGGFVQPIPIEDRFGAWKSEREVDIMVYLASLAGERLFYDGDNTTGVGGDMGSATTIAMEMEGFHAMGQTLGSHRVTKMGSQGDRIETGTDRMWLDTEFGRRVETRLEEMFARVTELLRENRIWVLALAHALEKQKTVPGEDIAAIIEGRPGPTIDGRLYHDPEFQRQLEEYHAGALRAHKQSDRTAIPLPRTPEPEPVPVAATTYARPNGDGDPLAELRRLGNGEIDDLPDETPPNQLLRAQPPDGDEPPPNGNGRNGSNGRKASES